MISIGCPSLYWLPFKDALGKVAGLFDGWEIVAEGKHLLPLIYEDLEAAISSFDMKFTVHAPLSDINTGSLNPGVRKEAIRQLVEVIEISHSLGMGRVTMHPGLLSPITFSRRELAMETTRKSIKEIEELTKDMDVLKCLENMPRFLMSLHTNPREMTDLISGTSFRLCLDIGHANTTGNLDAFLEYWEMFGSVHIHDNRGSHDEHLPIGEGDIDFEKVFEKLREYRGDYVIEARSVEEGLAGKRVMESLHLAAP